MRFLAFAATLLLSLSLAQASPSPRFSNYGGAGGLFADPAVDSAINPARIGTSGSSTWLPLVVSPDELIGGVQSRFAWNWGIPFEFALGINFSNDLTRNPYGDARTRFGFAVPSIPLQSSEFAGIVPLSVGAEVYATGLGFGINVQSSTDYYSLGQVVWGFGLGAATPDFDINFSYSNVLASEVQGRTNPARNIQFTQPALRARLKNEKWSGIVQYRGGPSPLLSLGAGWQTKLENTRVGVWGWVYSDTDLWFGVNAETPLLEGFGFLGSWSLFRDNSSGFSLEPLRLAVTYRNLPADLALEVPLYFQNDFIRFVRLTAGLSW